LIPAHPPRHFAYIFSSFLAQKRAIKQKKTDDELVKQKGYYEQLKAQNQKLFATNQELKKALDTQAGGPSPTGNSNFEFN